MNRYFDFATHLSPLGVPLVVSPASLPGPLLLCQAEEEAATPLSFVAPPEGSPDSPTISHQRRQSAVGLEHSPSPSAGGGAVSPDRCVRSFTSPITTSPPRHMHDRDESLIVASTFFWMMVSRQQYCASATTTKLLILQRDSDSDCLSRPPLARARYVPRRRPPPPLRRTTRMFAPP